MSRVEDRIEGRLIDPLIECVAELSRRYSAAFSRVILDQLPRGAGGRLPGHQAGAALELAGLNFEPRHLRKLPRAAARYPALVNLKDGDFALIFDSRETDVPSHRPTLNIFHSEPGPSRPTTWGRLKALYR